MRRAPDLLGLIDAIYRVDSSDDDWLSGIMAAALPALDEGHGMIAVVLRHSADGLVFLRSVDRSESPLTELLRQGVLEMPDLLLRLQERPVATASEVTGRKRLHAYRDFREVLLPRNIHDAISVTCREPDGWGVDFFVPTRSVQRIAPSARLLWQRIAGHVQSAHRLRRRFGSSVRRRKVPIADFAETTDGLRVAVAREYQRTVDDDAREQAVLDPAGRVLDAKDDAREAPAREALRRAAVALDRAKASILRNRGDADALGSWAALVDGRWSLLDRFDSDGRRFLIARRNEPGTIPVKLLDERERAVLGYRAAGHPLKLIAYEMGYSLGHASRLAQSAMNKLGLRTPADVVSFCRGAGPAQWARPRLDK